MPGQLYKDTIQFICAFKKAGPESASAKLVALSQQLKSLSKDDDFSNDMTLLLKQAIFCPDKDKQIQLIMVLSPLVANDPEDHQLNFFNQSLSQEGLTLGDLIFLTENYSFQSAQLLETYGATFPYALRHKSGEVKKYLDEKGLQHDSPVPAPSYVGVNAGMFFDTTPPRVDPIHQEGLVHRSPQRGGRKSEISSSSSRFSSGIPRQLNFD